MNGRNWLWVDVETTGLGYEPDRPHIERPDRILELAAIITTPDLVEVDSFGPVRVRTEESTLALMNDYVRDMHTGTGLLDLLRRDRERLPRMAELDGALGGWLDGHGLVEKVLLCGSSVKLDFDFIRRCLPEAFAHLGYRVIDVSSFKEALRDWAPEVFEQADAAGPAPHEAMADIRASIRELDVYRRFILRDRA